MTIGQYRATRGEQLLWYLSKVTLILPLVCVLVGPDMEDLVQATPMSSMPGTWGPESHFETFRSFGPFVFPHCLMDQAFCVLKIIRSCLIILMSHRDCQDQGLPWDLLVLQDGSALASKMPAPGWCSEFGRPRHLQVCLPRQDTGAIVKL